MTEERSRRGRNNKARGKSVEREVARLVGGKRVPDIGGEFADVQTETAVYEVKSRQSRTPALIAKAWHQATVAAEATGKDPYVVLAYAPGPFQPRELQSGASWRVLRAMRWPETAKPERLRARAWLERADGAIVAMAGERCRAR